MATHTRWASRLPILLTVLMAAASGATVRGDDRALVWEVLVDGAPDRVWSAVSSSAEAEIWIGGRFDVEQAMGGAVALAVGSHQFTGHVTGRVGRREITAQLVSASSPDPRARALVGTRWTMQLLPAPNGATLLRLSAVRQGGRVASWYGHSMLLALARLRTYVSAPAPLLGEPVVSYDAATGERRLRSSGATLRAAVPAWLRLARSIGRQQHARQLKGRVEHPVQDGTRTRR